MCRDLIYLSASSGVCIYSGGTWSPIILEIGTSMYDDVELAIYGSADPNGGQNGLKTGIEHGCAESGCLYGINPL